jgi:hypothetical protein
MEIAKEVCSREYLTIGAGRNDFDAGKSSTRAIGQGHIIMALFSSVIFSDEEYCGIKLVYD